MLKKGNAEIVALHDELYTGMLLPYLRRDIEYIPHIGIGLFVKKDVGYDIPYPKKVNFDAKLYFQALKEAKSLNVDSFDTVGRLFLEKVVVKPGASLHTRAPLNNDFTKIVDSEEIKL